MKKSFKKLSKFKYSKNKVLKNKKINLWDEMFSKLDDFSADFMNKRFQPDQKRQ